MDFGRRDLSFCGLCRSAPGVSLLFQGGRQDHLCQFSEVLGGGRQEELVPSTKRASQPEAIEAQDALQVRDSISIFFRSRRDVT